MPVQFEIHPSVGIARVGVSDSFFEGPGPGVTAPASYRDATGALRRQAARFRVFRCERDTSGRIVGTPQAVSCSDARIRWTVEVANRKAASRKLDQPDTANVRRNGATGNDTTDAALLIRPSARTVTAESRMQEFDDGAFRGLTVKLGKIEMQEDGSLVFTGGKGFSQSRRADGGTRDMQHFADNDDWFDDTCEGPVRAALEFTDGTTAEAVAARVVTGPPDFAPEIEGFVTFYDIAYQAAITHGFLTADERPSYNRHIVPFLRRAFEFAWVNQRASEGHGPDAGGDFSTRLEQLGSLTGPAARRSAIFSRLRAPTNQAASPARAMPRMFSEEGYRDGVQKVLALPPVFFRYFEQWVAGDFVADFGTDPHAGESLVDAMDRQAMTAAVGGGFFPGIEVPRFVRDPNVWVAAFRLDPAIPAGRVNEGLAVPWQADFSACQWEGAGASDPRGFAWWPSQRPDHVYRSVEEVVSGADRSDWDRGAGGGQGMIDHFAELGIIRRVRDGDRTVFIERERTLPG